MGLAVAALLQRFELVEAHAAEPVPLLRYLERHRQFIRAQRDWLYATLRGGWEPLLAAWAGIDAAEAAGGAGASDGRDRVWEVVRETYRFLAPRYTPITEWRSGGSARAAGTATPTPAGTPARANGAPRMVW